MRDYLDAKLLDKACYYSQLFFVLLRANHIQQKAGWRSMTVLNTEAAQTVAPKNLENNNNAMNQQAAAKTNLLIKLDTCRQGRPDKD